MILDAVIGLGASLGARADTLRLALAAIAAMRGVTLVRASRLYQTVPEGACAQPFLNAAARIRTTRAPRGLLAELRALELRLGRRPARRWADRALDLDLLIMGDLVRLGPALALPHPRMHLRRFALEPAVEVAADLVHPVLGRALGALPEAAGGRPIPACASVTRRALARDVGATLPMGPPENPMLFFLENPSDDEIGAARGRAGYAGVRFDRAPDALDARCELAEAPVLIRCDAGHGDLLGRARALAAVHEAVVVELPADAAGLRAARALAEHGVDTAMAPPAHPALARLAARAGVIWLRVDEPLSAAAAMSDLWPRATRLLGRGPGVHARLLTPAALAGAA